MKYYWIGWHNVMVWQGLYLFQYFIFIKKSTQQLYLLVTRETLAFRFKFQFRKGGVRLNFLNVVVFLKIAQTPKRDHFSWQVSLLIGHKRLSWLFISDLYIFPLKMIPKRKADCRKAGYSQEFLVGVCRPVLQILILFQTKKLLFFRRVFRSGILNPYPLSNLV